MQWRDVFITYYDDYYLTGESDEQQPQQQQQLKSRQTGKLSSQNMETKQNKRKKIKKKKQNAKDERVRVFVVYCEAQPFYLLHIYVHYTHKYLQYSIISV